jgi:predicted  nucleic acid-binding Zn-ribbon protein
MDYQFTTSCNHHGTIKPVQSTEGKHAGKWFCRIQGPAVTSKGMNVKTIYCAPYLGAAKASIAKFLGVTVSTISTSGEHSGTSTPFSTSTPIAKKNCGRDSSNNLAGEFDDNDDELASFDLETVVQSAKKQKLSPNPYASARTSASITSKPPTIPKQHLASDSYPVSQQKVKELSALEERKSKLQNDIKSTLQQKEVLDNETKAATQELDKLRGTTRAVRDGVKELTREKNQLQNDINKLRQEKSDAALESQEANKLKGKTRAMREEYDKLVADVKKLQIEKDCCRNEKSRLDKEVEEAKKALNKLSSMKSEESLGDSTAEGAAPKKKRNASKKAGGTVVASMKVADLLAEATARGLEVKAVSRMNKNELISTLVVGSMCITKSETWVEVLRVREQFENDRKKAADEERKRQDALDAQRRQQEMKRQAKEMERQAKLQAEREEKRSAEIASQAEKHIHLIPKVHGCKLAKTSDLLFYEEARIYRYSSCCSVCRSRYNDMLYSCEKCDFDICSDCHKEKTMTEAEKKAEAKRKAALEKERQEAEAAMRRQIEEEEEEFRQKWDPKSHFKPNIINPPDANLDPDVKKGYVVWSSDGYGYDGWHSYEGPPEKVYDSTWSTKANANERARYLFHWKNPWGHEAEHMMEEEHIVESKNDGLIKYVTSPDDSSTWTVAVTPAAAFAHLDNVRKFGNHHDDDEEDYEPTARGFTFL